MNIIMVPKIYHKCLFISDIHLRATNEKNYNYLLDLLYNLPQNTDVLVFLGDIFDFIYARSFFYLKKWQNLVTIFNNLKKQGIDIILIEGNHDFGFSYKCWFWQISQIPLGFNYISSDFLIINHVIKGSILCSHGDLIITTKSYLKMRKIIKHKIFQMVASFCPGFFMNYLFLWLADKSRESKHTFELTPTFFFNCLNLFLNNNIFNSNIIVMGHIHKYIDLKYKNYHILSGLDWQTNPNYLMLDENGSFSRIFLQSQEVSTFL